MLFNKFKIIKRSVTLPIKTIGSICMASGLILLTKVIGFPHLVSLTENYRVYLNLTFIISLSILLVNLISVIYIHLSSNNDERKYNKEIIDMLSNLSSHEYDVIQSFHKKNNYTLTLYPNNSTIKKLEYYRIIYKIKDINIYDSCNCNYIKSIYTMNPWVCYYLENISKGA